MSRQFKILNAWIIISALIISLFSFAAENVYAEGTVDTTPPVINSITLSATELKASETLEVTADVSDDVSGVNSVSLAFVNSNGKKVYGSLRKTYWDEVSYEYKTYGDGKWHCTLNMSQYEANDTYQIYYVLVEDVAGNSCMYYPSRLGYTSSKQLPASCDTLSFTIKNADEGKIDTKAPEIETVTLSTDTVEVPGTVEITADVSDDISGVSSVSLAFVNSNGKKVYGSLRKTYWDEVSYEYKTYGDGKWHCTLNMSQYEANDTYQIYYVLVEDIAGNSCMYYPSRLGYTSSKQLPTSCDNLSFKVSNSGGNASATTSTSADVAGVISSAPDGTTIAVDYSSKSTVSSDAFTALQGTDKNMLLTSEGVTWEFNGKDIVNESKNVDLSTEIKPLNQVSAENKETIDELVEDTPTVVVTFAENGELPGKAKIRLKVDYSLKQYLGTSGLYVYYLDNMTESLVPISGDISVTSDNCIEFEIEHCSQYLITGKSLDSDWLRIAGDNRYATAIQSAEMLKTVLGAEKFSTVVIASGVNFPDALAGSPLAAQKNAPILLVGSNDASSSQKAGTDLTIAYVKNNLEKGGTVYILGGEAAVSAATEKALKAIAGSKKVKRLSGDLRYDTNMAIIDEMTIPEGTDVVIVQGYTSYKNAADKAAKKNQQGYADSLSVSGAAGALGMPIFLADKTGLTEAQQEKIRSIKPAHIYVIGGENAVSKDVYAQVKTLVKDMNTGTKLSRIAGETRYETSVAIAEKFFGLDGSTSAVVAYGQNFPDGLTGGVLAAKLGAPLLLAESGKTTVQKQFLANSSVSKLYVLGGKVVLSYDTINELKN